MNSPVAQCVTGLFYLALPQNFGNCVIFMAEPIRVATSAMWLGTIKVVVASAATFE